MRGIGIVGVLFLHFSLYNFAGLMELDMSDPPLVIKILGFALMWASLFAVVSAAVLAWTAIRAAGEAPGVLPGPAVHHFWRDFRRRKLAGGGLVLLASCLYFWVLGPGIFDFAARSVDRSLLVGLVVEGRLVLPSPERLLYIDSLVMIGLNLVILTPLVVALARRGRLPALFWLSLAGAVLFLGLGLVRIPLYEVYLDLAARGSPLVFPFNLLVNKNNPLLPFLGFGFLGLACGCALADPGRLKARLTAGLGAGLLTGGVAAYLLLPDTMLKRAIDETWFCIMVLQAGFLTLVVLGAGRLGLRHHHRNQTLQPTQPGQPARPVQPGAFADFLQQTGRVSLTLFLAEPVLTALAGALFSLVVPGWNAGLASTLAGGLVYVLLWLPLILLWRRAGYRWGLEWLFARLLGRQGRTATRWPVTDLAARPAGSD